ncbi:MAG TPA: hypothetical protein VMP68_27300 [Candidatus Eisenbacteria bacterium]|nr:hypothetical protein [Candidatus Eisenbacteria bacterium]
MNCRHHISRGEVLIALVCVANFFLLVAATFYRGGKPRENFDLREKIEFLAIFLALSSQVFYLLMFPFGYEWLVVDPDNFFHRIHIGFYVAGFWLSVAALCTACFGRGIRRLASIWVAVTTGFLWSLVSLAFLFSKP